MSAIPWLIRSEIQPAFDGGLLQSKFLIGGILVVPNKAQRNSINPLNRRLDASTATLVIVTEEFRIYQLINNPATLTTQDSDWTTFFIGQTSSFRPVGLWDADNDDIILQDSGAVNRNGEFYFVSNAVTQRTVQYTGLFGGVTESVTNGDLVVSIGDKWVVITSSVQWDTLSKPAAITNYVNGIVIHHTHPITDIDGLTAALDLKYDSGDTAPIDIAFASVSDTALIQTQFLRQWYYTKSQVDSIFLGYYTKSEVDSIISGSALIVNDGNGTTWNSDDSAVDIGGALLTDTVFSGNFALKFGTSGSKIGPFTVISNDDVNIIGAGNIFMGGAGSNNLRYIGTTQMNLGGPGMGILSTTTATTFTDNAITPRGIQYNADYSATFVTRSLTDVGYVQSYVLAAKSYTGKQTFNVAPQLTTSSTIGYVWTATDALGNGSWQVPTGGGGGGGNITGSGNATQIAIFSTTTGIVGDAQLIYDSTNNILSTDRFHHNSQSTDPSVSVTDGDEIYQSTLLDFRGRANGQWINFTRPEIIIDNSSTSITLNESYRNKKLYLGAATSITVNAGNISVGFIVRIYKTGIGNITFTNTGGTSLDPSNNTISTLHSGATFTQKSSTKWHIEGAYDGAFPAATFGSNITIQLTAGKTLGKYTNGQTISSTGMTFEQFANDIGREYIPPFFNSFGITGQSTTVELGTTLSGAKTFTFPLTANSGIVSTVDIFNNTTSSTLLAGTPADGTQVITITTVQLNADGATQSWKAIGNNTSPLGTFDSSNFVVIARSVGFYGPTSTVPSNSAAVRGLPSSRFQTSGNIWIMNTGTVEKIFAVAILSTYSLTNVTDLDNGNTNITSFYASSGTISVLDAGGTSRTYNLYAYQPAIPYGVSARHQFTTT